MTWYTVTVQTDDACLPDIRLRTEADTPEQALSDASNIFCETQESELS